ncbi:LPS assembly protein LptD [Streptomyces caniferus]|uniref:LPS assembly protein LptD n=1 Tax=Streptomyces caniferus TaxID=285557 RepID=UPI00383AB247
MSCIDAGQPSTPAALPPTQCQWKPKRHGNASLQVRGYFQVSKSAQSQHRRRYAGKHTDSRGSCDTSWSRPLRRPGFRTDASCRTTQYNLSHNLEQSSECLEGVEISTSHSIHFPDWVRTKLRWP